MSTPRWAALLLVAGSLVASSTAAAGAATTRRVAPVTVVHVSKASGQVLVVGAASARLRSLRVGRARLTGLERGHRIAVRTSAWATDVERIGARRVRTVSFVATVTGARRGRPVIRLAAGVTVLGPRASEPSASSGREVLVTWRLSTRTGAIERFSLGPPPGPAGSADVRLTSARKRPKGSTTASPTPAPTAPAGDGASTTTVPAPGPAPPDGRTLVFGDEFSGASGAPADPAKWVLRGEVCDDFTSHSCAKDANVFQDGAGNLVLRARREATSWLGGGPYSGAFLGTFQYGSGWPPQKVTASWSVPYRIEMRALMPRAPGLWAAAWDMNVDRSAGEGPWELDWAELRMSHPTSAGCFQHRWVRGVDVAPWAGGLRVTDMAENWHVYSADVFDDRVEYRVDGALCGVAPGVQGRFGLLLDLVVGAPGSWGSGGGEPSPADGGPWDMRVDYVRVTRPPAA